VSKTILYSDAGCRKDLALGSYAYYVDDFLKGSDSLDGHVNPTSCELLAVVIGLKRLAREGVTEVEVRTDSQYVAGVMNNPDKWKEVPDERKSHRKMVARLFKAMGGFNEVKARWIPEGSELGNEIAHRMASARLREVRIVHESSGGD